MRKIIGLFIFAVLIWSCCSYTAYATDKNQVIDSRVIPRFTHSDYEDAEKTISKSIDIYVSGSIKSSDVIAYTISVTNNSDYDLNNFNCLFNLKDTNNSILDTKVLRCNDVFHAHESIDFAFESPFYTVNYWYNWDYESPGITYSNPKNHYTIIDSNELKRYEHEDLNITKLIDISVSTGHLNSGNTLYITTVTNNSNYELNNFSLLLDFLDNNKRIIDSKVFHYNEILRAHDSIEFVVEAVFNAPYVHTSWDYETAINTIEKQKIRDEEQRDDNEEETISTETSHTCDADNCQEKWTKAFIGLSGKTEYYCEKHYNEMKELEIGKNANKNESKNNSTTTTKPSHICEVDNCYEKGTRSITGLSGKTEYYCEKHYKEMQDIVDKIFSSNNEYKNSSSSKGSSITTGQRNALRSAESYLRAMGFSYSGLIEQLEFEGYSYSEAVYAVDHCGANWNEQAARVAKKYLNIMGFSRQGLIEQLQFEGFTYSQAVYGVEQNGY